MDDAIDNNGAAHRVTTEPMALSGVGSSDEHGDPLVTLHAVLVEPRPIGLAATGLVESGVLTTDEAAELYGAMVADTLRAVELSGGDLLVNYRDAESLPDAAQDADPESDARSLAESALEDPSEARFEVQVGSSRSARAGNTTTHLLVEEAVDTVAIIDPRAPTLGRPDLDGAAMKLRRHELVLGPSTGGRVAYLGLSEPIDFEGLLVPPALERVVNRGLAEDLEVDFLPMHPLVGSIDDLRTLVSLVRAREGAGVRHPQSTVATIDRLGIDFNEPDA